MRRELNIYAPLSSRKRAVFNIIAVFKKNSKSILNAAALGGLGLLAWPLECHDVSVDRQCVTT